MNIFDPNRLMTESLRRLDWGERAARIMAAAIKAVEPGNAVRKALLRHGEILTVAGKEYSLADFEHIYLVGAGKAGAPMAAAVEDVLGSELSDGIVIVKEGYSGLSDLPDNPSKIEIIEAGHPLPDERGVQATQRIISLLERASKNDLIICLISGGGSALLTAPVEGVSLADLQELTTQLLRAGATIHEINTLRKHLDRVKGGGLARMADEATLITLILSDVVGDPLDIIASGPTVPDPSTFYDAYRVLERYHLLEDTPANIVAYILSGCEGQVPETTKQNEVVFQRSLNVIVGSNYQAARAALQQAEEDGFHSLLLTTHLQGEASQVGRVLAAIARTIARDDLPLQKPACVIAGGETTVTVHGQGLGGRNQELVLGAVPDLAGLENVAIISLATDGGDGPTDAAGAVATGETLVRAHEMGLDPVKFLEDNDSYHFFAPLGDLLLTGPTLTNVNDLVFLFVGKE